MRKTNPMQAITHKEKAKTSRNRGYVMKYPRGFHFFYRHEIRQLSSRESRKSRRRRVASPALVGFAECLQPDGTHKR